MVEKKERQKITGEEERKKCITALKIVHPIEIISTIAKNRHVHNHIIFKVSLSTAIHQWSATERQWEHIYLIFSQSY